MSTEMLNNPLIIQNEQEAIQFIRAVRKSKRANKKKPKVTPSKLPEAKIYTQEEYDKENGEFSKPYNNVDDFLKDLLS